jgi:hypothetical protein
MEKRNYVMRFGGLSSESVNVTPLEFPEAAE